MIVIALRKHDECLKRTLRLSYNGINSYPFFVVFSPSPADSNLYLRTDSIVIPLYMVDISTSYPVAAATVMINVKVAISEIYTMKNFSLKHQFLRIEITCNGMGSVSDSKLISPQF